MTVTVVRMQVQPGVCGVVVVRMSVLPGVCGVAAERSVGWCRPIGAAVLSLRCPSCPGSPSCPSRPSRPICSPTCEYAV